MVCAVAAADFFQGHGWCWAAVRAVRGSLSPVAEESLCLGGLHYGCFPDRSVYGPCDHSAPG